MISIPLCSILYAIKGGQHAFIKFWLLAKIGASEKEGVLISLDGEKPSVLQKVVHRLLDGKVISTFGFFILCLFFYQPLTALFGALGWLAGVAPRISPPINDFRAGDWKPLMIRGVYLGACISFGLWNPWFILAGATYPLCMWVSDKVSKEWWVSELLIGAAIGAVFLV